VTGPEAYERPAIAGSGAIACGLAACATSTSRVLLLARSDQSAWKAEEKATELSTKLESGDPSRIKVTTDPAELTDCDLIVEAIVEEHDAKVELFRTLADAAPGAHLASTTSSLTLGELAEGSGTADRFFGLHPFNPVVKMDLVELCVPDAADEAIAARARAWCEGIGKTVVEVPDQPGFVVNRLLFPFLFDAVRFQERTGMSAEDVDNCMTLGAGHPMGPLALLDLVGIDVSVAIGEALHSDSGDGSHRPPERLRELAAEGKLGRKSGSGFYDY
jgi:3-hydroxybutyryl-CoA dehydrogenase